MRPPVCDSDDFGAVRQTERVTYGCHRRGLFGERRESFSYESRIEYQELTGLIMTGCDSGSAAVRRGLR